MAITTEHTIARRLAVEGVPNLGEVSPTLYRGAQPTREGFRKLADMGIRIVVDLRERDLEVERRQVTKLGMRFVAIPWNCFHPEDTDMARFLRLLRHNRGKKVFVHCQTGDDRTGMMIAAYRMAEEGWTAAEAMNEMEAYGFTSSHHLICPGLSSYEATFPRRFKTSPAFRDLRHRNQWHLRPTFSNTITAGVLHFDWTTQDALSDYKTGRTLTRALDHITEQQRRALTGIE